MKNLKNLEMNETLYNIRVYLQGNYFGINMTESSVLLKYIFLNLIQLNPPFIYFFTNSLAHSIVHILTHPITHLCPRSGNHARTHAITNYSLNHSLPYSSTG